MSDVALPERYFRAHTLGTALRATFSIYGGNFGTFFLITILPQIVWLAVMTLVGLGANAAVGRASGFALMGSVVVGMFVGSFICTATMYAISDIILGNRPSAARAFRRAGQPILFRMLATNLLQVIVLFIGLILLIIPGIFFMAWYYVAIPVVVFENTWGRAALRRSHELGKGLHGRTVGILLATGVLFYLFMIVGVGAGLVLPGGIVWASVAQAVILPVLIIPMVLVYYDLRLRKEGFTLATFTEALRD